MSNGKITDYWKQGAEHNKNLRIPWQKVLGCSLTKWSYLQFDAGATPDYALNSLIIRIKNYLDREASAGRTSQIPEGRIMDKAKISVSARWSEYNRRR